MIDPFHIIGILKQAKVRFVVMGTHGVGGWRSEFRTTHDVDVLVIKRHVAKAIQVLKEAFPDLEFKDTPVVFRFIDPTVGMAVIDIMKPTQEVFKMVFRHTIEVAGGYRIPNLEMALVSKFAAMTSPHRQEAKKYIDAGDFIDMVQTNQEAINLKRLTRLASKVNPNRTRQMRHLVDDIAAGRPIKF